jgi:hypothetical protein
MKLPLIDDANINKPLCYDPDRLKFIRFNEIIAGEEKIIRVETLSDDNFKKLVIERFRSGPDFTVQAMSGKPHSRDDLIEAIEKNTDFGQVTLLAEKSYLQNLLNEIQRSM